jgi:O-antigen/teichoic acid export membrane protein
MYFNKIGWNFLGLCLPLILAGFAIPYLLHGLGQERFGLLALAWGLIGYAGVLDIGMGRAVTQMTSKAIGDNRSHRVPEIFCTAINLTFVIGVLGALVFGIFVLGGGSDLIKTTDITHNEIFYSGLLVAIAIPTQALCATYRGLSEAFLHFRGISLLRIFLGLINFGAPVCVLYFTHNFAWLIAGLVVGRVLATFGYRYLALRILSDIKNSSKAIVENLNSSVVSKELLTFGGWVTVSSLISPLLVQADRFVIGYILSATAVAAYVIPFELVVQSLIIVGAITAVLFPRFSRLITENSNALNVEFKIWTMRIGLIMGAICILIAFSLPFFLPFWLSHELGTQSIVVGQVLCVGVFANSIGAMHYIFLQAKGLSKTTAKIHLVELPIFLVGLYYLVSHYGIVGAACAWSFRMIIDALALNVAMRLSHD